MVKLTKLRGTSLIDCKWKNVCRWNVNEQVNFIGLAYANFFSLSNVIIVHKL